MQWSSDKVDAKIIMSVSVPLDFLLSDGGLLLWWDSSEFEDPGLTDRDRYLFPIST